MPLPNRVTFRLAVLVVAFFGACGEDLADPDGEPATPDSPSPIDWQSQGGALRTAPTKPTRTIAAMMFNIGGTPPNAANIMNVVGGAGASQRHMFQEISYGIQDLAPEYFGPFTLPVANCLTIACCGPSSDRTGNGATVQMHMDGLGKTFNHYFWVYGNIPSGANCGTWGDEGTPNQIAKYSSYSFHQLVGYAQEIGHNFGMTHEPTLTCTGSATFLDNTAQCTHKEYGSTLSFMGGGSRHPSAVHKAHQGWISGCNVVKAGSAGSFTLVPQELPCDGVQLIQIPAPKTRPAPAQGDRQGSGPMLTHYYLEMRAPYGFDSGLGPMVLVSIGPEMTAANRSAPYVYLLDMVASTATHTDAGLRTVGQSYSDPGGGLTITLDAIDNMHANVTITSSGTGANTCSNSTAFSPPGPGGESCGPLFGGGGATGAGGSTGAGGRGGTTGAGGRGGTTGAAGTTGAGGTTATGAGGRGGTGAAGTTGTGAAGTSGPGVAGTTGSTGAAGTTGPGIAGTTGSTGAAGTTGAGVAGTTGSSGVAGSTGSGTAGTIGSGVGAGGSSTTGGAGGPGGPGASEVTGGCTCDLAPTGPSPFMLLFASTLFVVPLARRRRARAPRR